MLHIERTGCDVCGDPQGAEEFGQHQFCAACVNLIQRCREPRITLSVRCEWCVEGKNPRTGTDCFKCHGVGRHNVVFTSEPDRFTDYFEDRWLSDDIQRSHGHTPDPVPMRVRA